MKPILNIHDFLALSEHLPVVDVRSPSEFARGHFPGAYNIPLFSDEERALVGTAYKQDSRKAALMKGFEIAGPHLAEYVKKAWEVAGSRGLLMYCWRGGMRSASMAWLFRTAGIPVATLEGGYRSYRRYLKSSLQTPVPLVVIGGMTGSGKTRVLNELEKKGIQVIDLEGLACHRGSAFGALGQPAQPATEQFENNLFQIFRILNPARVIMVEDESKSIGSVQIPDEWFLQMKKAPVIVLDVPRSVRIEHLVEEYAGFNPVLLKDSLTRIRKKLGGERWQQAMKALEQNDFHTVADIALQYYDKAYRYGLSRRDPKTLFTVHSDNADPRKTALHIIDLLEQEEKLHLPV
ncbi:MAG TPA: tRNA 2-selenouridine(34) synthase MnmH [Bacteroidetes bacterium]|nr:tRNA 2-selenouridine(34) synthase MnmH [Bacteroidota bacterium]